MTCTCISLLKRVLIFLLISLYALALSAQQLLHDGYLARMKEDMEILASDSLEGREAGSMGELWAALYIAERFEQMGIAPYFDGCYYQDFDFPDGMEYVGSDNSLMYRTKEKEAFVSVKPEEYTMLPWGADGNVLGRVFDAGYGMAGYWPFHKENHPGETDKDQVFLIRFDAPEDDTQPVAVNVLMQQKVKFARQMGAKAVIFWDPDRTTTIPPGLYVGYSLENVTVPVLFLMNDEFAKTMPGMDVQLKVKASPKRSFGKNVAAMIDHGAERTIVIGAHFDHLGYGGSISRYGGLPKIHYGADDNASGVTGLLAIAGYLAKHELKNNNYLFVAFSAEEKGLIGSRIFAGLEAIHPDKVLCMLNYDMIGRVDSLKPEIQLLASGSSPLWEELLDLVQEDVKGVPVHGSVNGSDHHHFYRKQIPVLFFFNGLHEDYHKPSDVAEKINYRGIRDVVEYNIHLLNILDTLSSLPFSEVTSEANQRTRRAGKIALGIIPAHGVEAEGLQVEDVIPLKPAALAGIQQGDVISVINGQKISNIVQYMKALDALSPGQKVKVTVMRDGKLLVLEVQL